MRLLVSSSLDANTAGVNNEYMEDAASFAPTERTCQTWNTAAYA